MFRRINRHRLRSAIQREKGCFALAMVVVPNLVHAAIPALRLVLPHRRVIVIDNGLRNWELEWLRDEVPGLTVVRVITSSWSGPQVMIGHGEVINQFSACVETDFGFIDPDCYVFDPQIIDALVEDSAQCVMAAAFWYRNQALSLDVPDTFLMGINQSRYQRLTERFGVQFGVQSALPERLGMAVSQKWPGLDHHPHPWKPYFDTVHAVALAAAVEGSHVSLIPSTRAQVIHIGGTSYHTGSTSAVDSSDHHQLNAHFFHLALLERHPHPKAMAEFSGLLQQHKSSVDLLRNHQKYALSEACAQTRELLSALDLRGVAKPMTRGA